MIYRLGCHVKRGDWCEGEGGVLIGMSPLLREFHELHDEKHGKKKMNQSKVKS